MPFRFGNSLNDFIFLLITGIIPLFSVALPPYSGIKSPVGKIRVAGFGIVNEFSVTILLPEHPRNTRPQE